MAGFWTWPKVPTRRTHSIRERENGVEWVAALVLVGRWFVASFVRLDYVENVLEIMMMMSLSSGVANAYQKGKQNHHGLLCFSCYYCIEATLLYSRIR